MEFDLECARRGLLTTRHSVDILPASPRVSSKTSAAAGGVWANGRRKMSIPITAIKEIFNLHKNSSDISNRLEVVG